MCDYHVIFKFILFLFYFRLNSKKKKTCVIFINSKRKIIEYLTCSLNVVDLFSLLKKKYSLQQHYQPIELHPLLIVN